MDEQVSTPEPAVPEAPSMGMVARFIAVFTDPRKAFASLRKNYEWLVALLIVTVFAMGSYQFTKPLVVQDQLAAIEERLDQNPNIPEERKEEILESVAERFENPVWQFLTPVFLLVALVIGAAVLLFLGNIIMGGQASFLAVMNMFALSWLIVIPETIVKVPLMLSKGSTKVHTSLALLVSSDQANSFLGTLLGKFDLFGLWQLVLVIVGMSVLARCSVSKSAWAVGITWFVWVLIQGGLASLGINLGG